jgi:hypothetical protein
MYRKFYPLTFFVSLFLVVFLPLSVHGQATPAQGINMSCLEPTWCRNVTDKSICTVSSPHRVRLKSPDADKSTPNSKVYVTECLMIDWQKADGSFGADGIPEPYCTTGNSQLDMEILGVDNRAKWAAYDAQVGAGNDIKYTLGGGTDDYGVFVLENGQYVRKNPPTTVTADSFGNIPLMEWQSYTRILLARKYIAMNFVDGPSTSEGDNGGLGGQQQADLGYRIKLKAKECGGFSWDPYGRVFDSKSLEPIPNAEVTLNMYNTATKAFEAQYANQMNPNIVNPQPVNPAGRFTFVVKDGDYTLKPTVAGYNQAQATDRATLPVNTTQIYSNLYFSDSDPIQQRGVIQQRDIVMNPTDGTGKKYPLQILTYGATKLAQTEIVEGKVSHPFAQAKVQICDAAGSCRDYRTFVAASGGPDKEGDFKLVLDLAALVNGEKYSVTFSPVDLATSPLTKGESVLSKITGFFSHLIGVVEAADRTTSVKLDLEPIPSYLEGYAYDAQGNIMSNAVVKIYVPYTERPFYSVKTDEKGYYRLTSNVLPQTNYSVAYESPDKKEEVTYTTSQVLSQNKKFIESEKIDPYFTTTAQNDPRRTVTPSYVPEQKISVQPVVKVSPSTAPVVSPVEKANQATKTQNPMFLVGAILLLLVATAGTLLAVYLYRKRMTNGPTNSSV